MTAMGHHSPDDDQNEGPSLPLLIVAAGVLLVILAAGYVIFDTIFLP